MSEADGTRAISEYGCRTCGKRYKKWVDAANCSQTHRGVRIADARGDLQRVLQRIQRDYQLQDSDVIAVLKLEFEERVFVNAYRDVGS